MATRLFVVHGSHPSAAVKRALELKGVDYKLFEFTPPTHALGMRVLFGGRTVPGIRFDDGEKVQGSLAIMQALERRYPQPRLYPSDPDARAGVVEAERWGEATFQPIARRIIWPAFARNPEALHSFQQGSKLPALPLGVIKLLAPGITAIERASTTRPPKRSAPTSTRSQAIWTGSTPGSPTACSTASTSTPPISRSGQRSTC